MCFISMVMWKARERSLTFPDENGSSSLESYYNGVKSSLSTLPNYLKTEYGEERKKNDVLSGAEVSDRRNK